MTEIELLTTWFFIQLLQLTIVIVLVLVANHLLCRARPHLAYLLLLIVVIKAVTPPLLASHFGIFSNLSQTIAVRSSTTSFHADSTLATEGSLLSRHPENWSGKEMASTEMTTREFSRVAPIERRRPPRLAIVAALIWIAGVCVAMIVAGMAYRRACRFALRVGRRPDATTVNTYHALKRRLGIRLPTRLVMGPESMGPCCFGLFVPTILLPDSVRANATKRQLEIVLTHELVHARRHDTRVALVQLFAFCIWWFHPLMWLVSRQLSNERERCCDDEVRATLDCSPAEYAQTILDFSRTPNTETIPNLATGAGGVRVTKRRLEDIMKRKSGLHAKTPKWQYLILVAGCVLVVPGTPIRISAQPSPQQSQTTQQTALDPQQRLYADVKTLPDAIEALHEYLDAHEASEYKQLLSEESVKAGIKNTLTAITTRARIQLESATEPEAKKKFRSHLDYLAKHVEPICNEVAAGNWPENVYFFCMTPKPKFSTLTVNLFIDQRNADLGEYKIGDQQPTAYGVNIITLHFGLEPRLEGPITAKVIQD